LKELVKIVIARSAATWQSHKLKRNTRNGDRLLLKIGDKDKNGDKKWGRIKMEQAIFFKKKAAPFCRGLIYQLQKFI